MRHCRRSNPDNPQDVGQLEGGNGNTQQQEAQRVRGHLLVTWEWCVGTGGAMGDLATAVAWMVMWSVPTKNETRRTASQTRCKQRAKRVPTAPRTIGHLKASVGVASPNQGGDMSKTIKKDRCKNTWDRVRSNSTLKTIRSRLHAFVRTSNLTGWRVAVLGLPGLPASRSTMSRSAMGPIDQDRVVNRAADLVGRVSRQTFW